MTGPVSAALERFELLIGEWEIEVVLQGDSPETFRGSAQFSWSEDGAFVVQRSRVDGTGFPSVVAVMGADDSDGGYVQLYHDSRGVSRIYQMRLSEEAWQLWREAPGFSQRFVGTFSEDGSHIAGKWEKSVDGTNWEHDFVLNSHRKPR